MVRKLAYQMVSIVVNRGKEHDRLKAAVSDFTPISRAVSHRQTLPMKNFHDHKLMQLFSGSRDGARKERLGRLAAQASLVSSA